MVKHSLRYRFWKRILYLAKREFKNAHMIDIRQDMKCPNCKEWMSITGLKGEHKCVHLDTCAGDYVITCGGCEANTRWSYNFAPFAVHVDMHSGIPPQNEKTNC